MTANKRAQVGKFLTGFVSFILIVLFIGVFIALSTLLAKTHETDRQKNGDILFFSKENNLLLQSIEIEADGKSQKILVADALVYQQLGKINELNLQNSLKRLMNE